MTNNLLNNLITIPSFNYSQSRKEVVRNKMNLRPNLKLKQLKQVNVTWVEVHVTGSDTPVIYTIAESDLKSAFQVFFCNRILFSGCLWATKVKENESSKHSKAQSDFVIIAVTVENNYHHYYQRWSGCFGFFS